jgi:hypothetical protein
MISGISCAKDLKIDSSGIDIKADSDKPFEMRHDNFARTYPFYLIYSTNHTKSRCYIRA